jgi:hypothetical protein
MTCLTKGHPTGLGLPGLTDFTSLGAPYSSLCAVTLARSIMKSKINMLPMIAVDSLFLAGLLYSSCQTSHRIL